MSALPIYREVWVVSDLHLGGYTGRWDEASQDWLAGDETMPRGPKDRSFRIFRDAPALVKTIGDAANEPGPFALVLNGDIVDFLADAQAVGFDPKGALAKLQKIVDDPEQRTVWQAFKEFLRVPNHDLVLVLGNHDVELGLSDVQEWLVGFLSEDQPDRRSRIVHCYDGKGFRCVVGGTIVHCVHGNSADPWNGVDYEALAKVSEARRLHAREPAFKVNAGSTLVVEHMNAVKRQYQWVDLLKPEREGAAAAVQVLDTKRSAPLLALARSVNSVAVAKSMFIGDDGLDVEAPTSMRTADDVVSATDTERWLAEAQERDTQGVSPLDLAGDDGMLEAVYAARRAVERWLGKSLRELLLGGIPNSTAWSLTDQDEVFKGQDAENDPNVDWLLAGHTHLERCIKRSRGRGHYYNSGTWILLMNIPTSALTTESAFAPIRVALDDGSLDRLLQPIPIGTGESRPIVRALRTVVKVWEQSPGASAALFHVEDDAERRFALHEVPGTRRSLSARGVQ